jgi:two-component system, chemotaxis family, chemotaxis protein CheY
MFVNRTVLLADDQSVIRHQLQEMLHHSGMTVVAESSNTDDALEKFDRLRPNVVVIDVTLPGTLDALVVIQRMTRMDPQSTIFATAMASQNRIVMEALTMGAVDFFLKPFQPTSIRTTLQRNVG